MPDMGTSIDDLERAAAGGWQAPEAEPLGDWVLRAAEGFTGRANSALAIGDPGMPVDEAADRVCTWYRARSLRPMISVAFPTGQPVHSELDRYLAVRGWQVSHGALVMTATAEEIARRTAGALVALVAPAAQITPVTVRDRPDNEWLALYRHRGHKPPPVSRKLLLSAPWQAFASVRAGGQAVAIGRVAASGGWAGLTAVEVDPGHRRLGLGTAITAALAAAAAGRGVTRMYLQVAGSNDAARALYGQCGFADHHAYHYRTAG